MKTTLQTVLIVLSYSSIALAVGPNEDLVKACQKGDLAAAQKAISAKADVNALDPSGNPAITAAVFWPELTQLLLDNGADPNLGSYPAIISASNLYSVEVMKLLLAKGADPNKQGALPNPIQSLLDAEKAKGKAANKVIIKTYEEMLSKSGPQNKVTAIRQVVQQTNCGECLDLLIKTGANVQEKDPVDGGNLIHVFASFGNTAETRASMFRQGAPVLENSYGMKVPDWYKNMTTESNASHSDMLKKLISAGVDVNELNNGISLLKPSSPLDVALNAGIGNKKEVMLALVENGADVNRVHEQDGPVLIQATLCGFVEVVKAMVEKGANINVEDKMFDKKAQQYVNGFTPLTAAAMNDKLDVVQYLLEAGAKAGEGVHGFSYSLATKCATRVKNKTAIFFAIDNNNLEMVKLIQEKGAYNGKPVTINQLKQSSTSDFGSYSVTTTSCFKDGDYSPSAYAGNIGASGEVNTYLKSSGL
jgi:ankyrin repeat protein